MGLIGRFAYLRQPRNHLYFFCKQQVGWVVRKGNAERGGHAVRLDFTGRVLQLPRQMMNFETVGTKSCVDVVQAIQLGQELVQRAWLSVEWRTHGFVVGH